MVARVNRSDGLHFSKTDNAVIYVEIYEPLMVSSDPKSLKIGLVSVVVDRESGVEGGRPA